jgi:hypothetical protein
MAAWTVDLWVGLRVERMALWWVGWKVRERAEHLVAMILILK